MVELFIKGGGCMWPILFFLIFGLAISIERFISLTRATINTRKFREKIRSALDEGGIDAAK